ncbi:MAG: hypothetical protein Q4F99_02320 [bacterium]|nr:hypothetical protein [bacterium]
MKRWLAMLALMCASCVVADGASDTAKLVFGKNEASKERIDKGAIFIDGLFIRGPYTVTREGNLILVNGKVASRLKIEAEAEEADAEPSEEAEETVADETTEENAVDEASSETEDETIEEPLPPKRTLTREDKEAAAKERAEEMRKRSGHKTLAEKEEERKKAAARAKLRPAFNQEVVSSNPNALFEEADYTYTPPRRAEPKAVPYIRPEAKKSLKEQVAAEEAAKKAKAEAEVAEVETPPVKATPEKEPEVSEEDERLAEDAVFETLTEEEVARYVKALDSRQKQIEDALQKDMMIFLSSSTVAWKVSSKAVMTRFVAALEKLTDEEKFVKTWKDLPQGYLRNVYKHRAENAKNTKVLRLRLQRDARDAKNKPSRI